VGQDVCRQVDPDTLHQFSALTPCFVEVSPVRLTLIVNILDLLALLSPTALRFWRFKEFQGVLLGVVIWLPAPLGRIACVHVLDNDYHDVEQ
jgi:hypothetical protein